MGQEACWEPGENSGGQGQPWEIVQWGHYRVAREGPRTRWSPPTQGLGAPAGQLSFHPCPCPLTKMTTTGGLGRLGRTLSAAIQTSLSRNRDNLSHLTEKVNGFRHGGIWYPWMLSGVCLSALSPECSLSRSLPLSTLLSSVLALSSDDSPHYRQRRPSASSRPTSCQLSSPTGVFLNSSSQSPRTDTHRTDMGPSWNGHLSDPAAWITCSPLEPVVENQPEYRGRVPDLRGLLPWARFRPSKPSTPAP